MATTFWCKQYSFIYNVMQNVIDKFGWTLSKFSPNTSDQVMNYCWTVGTTLVAKTTWREFHALPDGAVHRVYYTSFGDLILCH